jgi:hypothetical protein
MLNMFVGVVISSFNNEKQKISNINRLTNLELEYINTCINCFKSKPELLFQSTGNKFRDILIKIAKSKPFNVAVYIAIFANFLVLIPQYYG